MKFLSESEKKAEEIFQEIEKHPLTVKVREDQALETLQKRKTAAEEIGKIEAEEKAILPPLQTKMESLLVDLEKAEEKVKNLQGQTNAVKQDIFSQKLSLEHRRGRAEVILLDSCDDQIHEAIKFFRDTLDKLRKPGVIVRIGRPSRSNPFKWIWETVEENNADAVKKALSYCQESIKNLEVMKLDAEVDAKRIEELKRGIPSIEDYGEIRGEQPLPRVPDPNPRKSDSQLDYERKKLDEKIKKVMNPPKPR